MRLHFVSAPGGSAFMHELLTVVALEVEAVMDRSRIAAVEISEGGLDGEPDDVFVVVPHEFFRVLPVALHPRADLLKRTIGFCVEHPGNDTFTTTLQEARRLGACVDINDDSTYQLAASGVPVERFQLGYSSHWDVWGGIDNERPLDVLYLGTADDRRSRFLAVDPETLADYEVFMAMPPHEPMTRPRLDFFMGTEKLRLLSESKILLNLHRSESVSFEWVRALESMSNGCVMVSEHSSDFAPFVAGRHFISGSPYNLGHIARAMLADPERLRAVCDETYAFLRDELTMRSAARMLADLAYKVADGPLPLSRPRRSHVWSRRWPRWASGITNLHAEDPPPKRTLDKSYRPPRTSTEHRATRTPGSLDALVLADASMQFAKDDADDLLRALQQIGDGSARVMVTGEDSFTEADRVRGGAIAASHTSGSPGERRNAALHRCDSEYVLVLDSIDRLLPGAIERLMAALGSSEADAAYGFVITPRSTFLSALPFEAERLNTSSYLSAASLWRRSTLIELGGWAENTSDPVETSLELWRRLGRSGGDAVLVPRPLVRQVVFRSKETEATLV
jgi:Glycosyl transferases group 1